MRTAAFIASDSMVTPPADIPVTTIEDMTDLDLETVAFFLIDGSDWQSGYRQLCQLRNAVAPELYLKPVIFLCDHDSAPGDITEAADGLIQGTGGSLQEQLENWTAKLERINKRIQQMTSRQAEGDTNIAFKVLRYIASRNMEFKPTASVRMLSGYVYPPLQPLFPKPDVGVFESLEYLESQKLLTGTLINHAYACTHCDCAFLNFFETCPECGSNNLSTDELIHHFTCAYVGELTEFRHGEDFICPKCDKKLKHIGVDYDKTSVVYHCHQCSNIFQDPGIMTSCYNCQRETEPENQLQHAIKSYSITAIGENAGQYGMDSLFQNILESKLHALPFEAFREFFRVEQARIKRYKLSTSTLAIFRLGGIETLYTRLGKRTHEIFHEISEAFKDGLRTSDIFSIRNETLFLVILTETTRQNGEIALLRIKERINNLLTTNLEITIEMDIALEQLSSHQDLDSCLEKLLSHHAV